MKRHVEMLIQFLMANDDTCRHIYLSDLMRFMRQEEALKAMDLFEGAKENNRVSKRSLKNWVVSDASSGLSASPAIGYQHTCGVGSDGCR